MFVVSPDQSLPGLLLKGPTSMMVTLKVWYATLSQVVTTCFPMAQPMSSPFGRSPRLSILKATWGHYLLAVRVLFVPLSSSWTASCSGTIDYDSPFKAHIESLAFFYALPLLDGLARTTGLVKPLSSFYRYLIVPSKMEN